MMKRLIALSGIALALLGGAPAALAQAAPPPLPALTPQQSAELQQRVDAYRRETDARVSRGEITPDEAKRLVDWREWQLAQQAGARAAAPPARPTASDVPPDYYEQQPPDYYEQRSPGYVVVEPPPYYAPYYRYPAPYYWAPRPYYYWGPSICAGGFGRHFGGRICL